MTCFGPEDRQADLVFGPQGVKLSIDAASAIVDWCWRNGLPMLSSAEEEAWMHEGCPLPPKAAYVPVARDVYEEQARRACLGLR